MKLYVSLSNEKLKSVNIMENFKLKEFIENYKIDRGKLASAIFPTHRKPYFILQNVLTGTRKFSPLELENLRGYIGSIIGLAILQEQDRRKSDKRWSAVCKHGINEFKTQGYKAHLVPYNMELTVYSANRAIHKSKIGGSNRSIKVNTLIDKLNKIVQDYEQRY